MATEALNMQRLRAAIQDEEGYTPGATVYGVGDPDHQSGSSDHNPDDTAGVRTPQTDADNRAEWRALDPMVRGPLTFAKADALAKHLASCATCRSRLMNIIWNRRIASRSWGWTWREYTGSNPHTDHVHVGGLAAQDENGADWPHVRTLGKDDDMPTVDEIWAKEFAEYVDENGNRVRDRRTVADILFASHSAAVTGLVEQRAATAAILAAIKPGADLASIKTAIQQETDAAVAELKAQLATDAAADTQRDTDLWNLIQAGESGEMDAAEVIRLMGERLSVSAGTPTV